jgi:hypothetical protein
MNYFENKNDNILTKSDNQKSEKTQSDLYERMKDPFLLLSYDELANKIQSVKSKGRENNEEWDKWQLLINENEDPIYEIWTKEYIDRFGDYLAKRVEQLGGSEENPVVILEIGAGNGRLTYFLNERINEILPEKAKILATDSGKWEIKNIFPVENISNAEAIAKYKPRVIISSWMPHGSDFTAEFRAAESVEEYILIGEADYGCCGRSWETWGENSFSEGEEIWEKRENEDPPYMKDGFEKVYNNELSEFQLSRVDICELSGSTSSTVSFKRKNKKLDNE